MSWVHRVWWNRHASVIQDQTGCGETSNRLIKHCNKHFSVVAAKKFGPGKQDDVRGDLVRWTQNKHGHGRLTENTVTITRIVLADSCNRMKDSVSVLGVAVGFSVRRDSGPTTG